ncbi:MAG TPA: DNA topoisomerase I [Candidatus Thiothrix moscowensis]|uniref:DNA topoisomerase I n=1 Tax=unclassified Thiothrix TaxID=2636184 RepID=UPI0025CC4E0F|nr:MULTISPECIES: DNA topoisomerase I [unclassified Thiothrix]HRJ51755.1 DNA topoisomerase I [Candidatus Thiothrix moscowensis]HRJ92070.1 DNA topoisomerase I [Candidatus Thiothrix moscowensis]
MSENLVIVESPAKGKTIQKYLGKGFEVLASYGHVRDLVPKEGAVDPANGYNMRYEIIDRNQRHVDAIARALKKADTLYLATDPDREGEAISWHLYELLKERGSLEGKKVQRVVFHEITRKAIQDAIQNPRGLAHDLIDAQQARRALDYLVGFNLSPLLWRKIKPSLSAGRVQSPALRLIVEREEEIENFVRQEYWTMTAQNEKDAQAFTARLHTLDNRKLDQFDLNNETQASAVRERLLKAANGKLLVSKVDKKQRKRYPAPPFTTSTLQQEAVRKLRFSTQRAMRIAQQLYEGIDLGSGPVGLITYMRTDSVNLANEAIAELRSLIEQRYGNNKLPNTPNFYKTKSKNAQEAHEAVRPTSALRTPEQVKQYLNEEQFKLYELIWKRTVACQMIYATLDTVSADLNAEAGSFFRASGSTIRDPGFLLVYEEGLDDRASEKESPLPPLEEGEHVTLHDIKAEQHFTEPPPRYSEASLVKALEEFGIGRPSTYASIISTLLSREYVELDNRRFIPTDIGRIVTRFLTEHFTQYVDYDFTANLEDQLDAISRGEKTWVPVMDDFWQPFHKLVDEKMGSVNRSDVLQSRELGTDPASGRPVSVRLGRFGPMVQIGTKDDEEKPVFASLRPGMKLDTVTLEEALELFKLPRHLGETADGKAISTNVGRFGPYVKYGDQFASLKKDDDPYTITLERALELIAEKQVKDAEKILRDFGNGIQILKGRWGPYLQQVVKRTKVQARLPKDREPDSMTLEECQTLLSAAADAKSSKKDAKKEEADKNKASDDASKPASKKVTAAAKGTKASPKKVATAKTASKPQTPAARKKPA